MDFAKHLVGIQIVDEMRNSYMDYSMSVIIGRALPDVRDGLKPVHRRILYAMHMEGLHASKKYSKCAGVVGEVLKKYHPHGDASVYDALVRMAQPWNLRYLLVDGQGNFGSVDGDPPAAYRYTECRMTKLAEEMLVDIEKETVSFGPNFDGAVLEPDVLPSRFPNLLVNGAEGIAVGMATKIPPHNLREIVDACIAVIENPDLDVDQLMRIVPGPDFPTYGTIYGRKGIRDYFESGRGRVVVRGKAEFEELQGGRRAIIIDEIPYQVNKSRFIEEIAELVRDKKIDGISGLRDESDRQGMRIVIELKKDAVGQVVLNHLYKHTALQTTFGVILLAVVNKQPRVLTVKDMLQLYVSHRREVIQRRTRFELAQAKARAHILEGFAKALDVLDALIALIRASANPAEAKAGMIARFGFTDLQADAILEMRLQRLTGMERQKILDELSEIRVRITRLETILGSETVLMSVVKAELIEIRDTYSDPRRTRFEDARSELTMHDLVAEEDQVVALSHLGYIKRCSPDEWRMQRRGGTGKQGMNTRDEDYVTSLLIANTHALLMVFTTKGRVFPLQVYDVPEGARTTRGKAIVNLVPIGEDERIASIVSVKTVKDGGHLLFVSKAGFVKRTGLEEFENIRQGGLIACAVDDGDALVYVLRVDGADNHLMLFTKRGKCIRFAVSQVPEYGRSARGRFGIELAEGDEVVDALVVPGIDELENAAADEADEAPEAEEPDLEGPAVTDEDEPYDTTLLTATELGFGKRVPFDRYRSQKRYGKGILSIGTSVGTGAVVGALEVHRDDQIMLATDTGRVIRIRAGEVRLVGSRSSKGVRLMRLDPGERIVDLTLLQDPEDEAVGEVVEPTATIDPADDGTPPAGEA